MIDPVDLITYSSDAALVISANQRVLVANKAARDLLGREGAAKLDLGCNELLRARQVDGGDICRRQCKAITDLRRLRPYAHDRCLLRRADGTQFEASLRTIALPDESTASDRPVAIVFITPFEPSRGPTDEPRLEIRTLGRFSLSYRESRIPIDMWARKQAVELLKLLVVQAGRPVHRERLIEHFWPETPEEIAWARLKVTVHSLRHELREAGCPEKLIETADCSYVLRTDKVWIDALAFDEMVRKARACQHAGKIGEAIQAYDAARQLYRGDFMEADLYADSYAEERERLCELYLELLTSLAELRFRAGDFAAALQDCHAALAREPCRESVHRLLIRSLIGLDRPWNALEQFDRFRRVLRNELGVDPSPETEAIVAPLLHSALAKAGHRPRLAQGAVT